MGASGRASGESPASRSWGLAVARPQAPALEFLRCPINDCSCFADCCFTLFYELMQRSWVVGGTHLGEEILIVNHTAQPREDSQVLVIARGADEEENIGEPATAAERNSA